MKDLNRFVLSLSSNFENLHDGIIFLDGYVEHDLVRYFSRTQFLSSIHDFTGGINIEDEPYGEWLAVRKTDNQLVCFADYFGFYRVYYSIVDLGLEKKLLLSNCFNALNDYLIGYEDVSPELDCEAGIPLLCSSDNFFKNNYSNHTFNKNIKTLRPNEVLSFYFKESRLEISERLTGHEGASQDELVSLGVKYLERSFGVIKEKGYNPTLLLSGGKDSRLCLSMMLSNFNARDFAVSTVTPSGKENEDVYKVLMDDFVLSNALADKFGLRFSGKGSGYRLKFHPADYFRYVSKYKSNNYFSEVSSSCEIDFLSSGDNVVEIRGGAGECLRTSSYYIDLSLRANRRGFSFGNVSESVDDDISLMYDLVCVTGKDSTLAIKAKEFFVGYLKSYPGENIEEKLNSRFYFDRNNRHFGHHIEKLNQGKRTFFPLANPFWHMAAKHSDFEDRKGRVFFNSIFSLFNPTVSLLPYTGDTEASDYYNCFSKRPDVLSTSTRGEMLSKNVSTDKSERLSNVFEFISAESQSILARDDVSVLISPSMKKYVKKKIDLKGAVSLSMFLKLKSLIDALKPDVSSYEIYK